MLTLAFFFHLYLLLSLVILTWPGADFGPKSILKKGSKRPILSIDDQKLIAPRRDSRIKTSAGPRGPLPFKDYYKFSSLARRATPRGGPRSLSSAAVLAALGNFCWPDVVMWDGSEW